MSAREVIDQIKHLSPTERVQVVYYVVENAAPVSAGKAADDCRRWLARHPCGCWSHHFPPRARIGKPDPVREVVNQNFAPDCGQNSYLAPPTFLWIVKAMSAQEMIAEFKALPPAERAQVTKFVVEHDDSWIPDEFKEAMKDAEAGRFVDMETALHETPPPRLR